MFIWNTVTAAPDISDIFYSQTSIIKTIYNIIIVYYTETSIFQRGCVFSADIWLAVGKRLLILLLLLLLFLSYIDPSAIRV